MPLLNPEELPVDLRKVLAGFWLDQMNDKTCDPGMRTKCSELLAKYFLGAGDVSPSATKKVVMARPSTADILGLIKEIEEQGDGSDGTDDGR